MLPSKRNSYHQSKSYLIQNNKDMANWCLHGLYINYVRAVNIQLVMSVQNSILYKQFSCLKSCLQRFHLENGCFF